MQLCNTSCYYGLLFVCLIESSTTGDSSQQDGGDVGPSFIERLPEGVSQQCKLYS